MTLRVTVLALLTALLTTSAAFGMGKPSVAALQVALRARGTYLGTIDGVRGPGTKAAVAAFQRRAGLAVDGVVGPRTRAALGRRGRPRARHARHHLRQRGLGRRLPAVPARVARLPRRLLSTAASAPERTPLSEASRAGQGSERTGSRAGRRSPRCGSRCRAHRSRSRGPSLCLPATASGRVGPGSIQGSTFPPTVGRRSAPHGPAGSSWPTGAGATAGWS